MLTIIKEYLITQNYFIQLRFGIIVIVLYSFISTDQAQYTKKIYFITINIVIYNMKIE